MKEIKSIDEFNKIIEKDKVIVDFYAEWCGPCKLLGPVLEEIEKETNIPLYKVNTDNFMDLSMKYKIMSIPYIIIFEKGNIKTTSIGLKSKEELLEIIK